MQNALHPWSHAKVYCSKKKMHMVQKGCFGFRQNVKSLRKKNTPPLHGKGRKLKKIRGNSHKKSNRRGARVGNEGQAALAAAARVLRLLLAERDMRGVVDVG